MANPLAGALIAGGLSLLGRRKKKATPQAVPPYLTPKQIAQYPYLQQYLQQFQAFAPSLLFPDFGARTQLSSVQQAMQKELFPELSSPTRQAMPGQFGTPEYASRAISSVERMMRPLFEEQVQRALEQTLAQIAPTLGTASGGAIAELLRRQQQDLERQYLSTLGQMGFEEMERLRTHRERLLGALPSLLAAEQQLPWTGFFTYQSLLSPFVSQQVAYPMYQPSPLVQFGSTLAMLYGLGAL